MAGPVEQDEDTPGLVPAPQPSGLLRQGAGRRPVRPTLTTLLRRACPDNVARPVTTGPVPRLEIGKVGVSDTPVPLGQVLAVVAAVPVVIVGARVGVVVSPDPASPAPVTVVTPDGHVAGHEGHRRGVFLGDGQTVRQGHGAVPIPRRRPKPAPTMTARLVGLRLGLTVTLLGQRERDTVAILTAVPVTVVPLVLAGRPRPPEEQAAVG